MRDILLRNKDKHDQIHKIITYEIYAFLREAPYSFLAVVCERDLSWRYSKKFESSFLSGIKISVNSKWCFSGLTRKHNKVKVFCFYILSAVPSIHLTPTAEEGGGYQRSQPSSCAVSHICSTVYSLFYYRQQEKLTPYSDGGDNTNTNTNLSFLECCILLGAKALNNKYKP